MANPTYTISSQMEGDVLTFYFKRSDGVPITEAEMNWLHEMVERAAKRVGRNVQFPLNSRYVGGTTRYVDESEGRGT